MRAGRIRVAYVALVVGLVLGLAVTLLTRSGGDTAEPGADATPTGLARPPATHVPEPDSEAGPRRTVPEQPNVVLVMADDMRVDDLAFAPNLRRMIAAHGVTFDNSFSPFPLCCPARTSFLTGQYAHNHKVFWHTAPYGFGAFDDSRTLATSLQRAGYRTGFIGKYLNRYGLDDALVTGAPSYTHVPRGWDDWRAAVEPPPGSGIHGNTYNYMDTPFNVNGVIDNRYRGVYQTGVIGDMSVDMTRRFARGAKPFFMYVNYVAPHHGGPRAGDEPAPIIGRNGRRIEIVSPAVPDWVRGRFDDRITRPSGYARNGEKVERDTSDKPRALQARLHGVTPRLTAALTFATRRRAEAVHVMDRQIARLVRALKRTGAWRDTVFAFTSDNGMFMGEHGLAMGKVRAHEPSLRVPLLVTGPGLRTAQTRQDPISTVDLTATVLDLADARPPHTPDGQSRVSTLYEGDQGWTTPVVTEAIHTSAGSDADFTDARSTIGIRVSQYSFTRYRGGAVELYDLVADPRQDRNVARDPTYAEVRVELQSLWTQVKDCVGKECALPLPPLLAADRATNETNTAAYWAEINDAYGW